MSDGRWKEWNDWIKVSMLAVERVSDGGRWLRNGLLMWDEKDRRRREWGRKSNGWSKSLATNNSKREDGRVSRGWLKESPNLSISREVKSLGIWWLNNAALPKAITFILPGRPSSGWLKE